ncbi:DEKNAAC103783 [Brettanomyces naardenensis]|uniref:DEKNAAC103783 n=1 Tax=Brettanomyces naardenensis TaxID=13370 RepID=A0A448YPA8_BRENA|nr:DEKNAAC103783 [Brettanomyces naardenensis]
MDALMLPGTVTAVLGRPGAGCSTLLKTIASQTYGFDVDPTSVISYDGLSADDIKKHYRGEVVYSAETDSHFPQLTVGETLEFAAALRTPENRPVGITREQYIKHMTKVYLATYGLSHTYDTKIGNEFIRGVSGGERKRVSIAEVSLCGSNLQCWDNATRGLDAATALEFVKALKVSSTLLDTTALISIYQCSQDAYDLFDNIIVLYEGRQIYYGPGTEAKHYFEKMGYICPQRQTTADFLTSVTSPAERKSRDDNVPHTSEEFEQYWKASSDYADLVKRISSYMNDCKQRNTSESFREAHVSKQSKHTSPSSPYRVSYNMQIKTIMRRNLWRFRGDPFFTVFSVVTNTMMGLILSSLFYNLPFTTGAFYYRTAALFFAVLFNAFSSLNEIMRLY